MIRIVCDSAADITLAQAGKMDVEILSLPIQFENKIYVQEKDTDFAEFYDLLRQAKKLPTTSQATPEDFTAVFRKLGAGGDTVIAILLSSGLSGTVQAAHIAKEMLPELDIRVVDSLGAVMAHRILVEEAVRMRDEGSPAEDIVARLVEIRPRIRTWAMVDTLTYLAKGGRLNKTVAFAGNLIGVKPIITIKGDGTLDVVSKARGYQAVMKKFADGPAYDPDYPVYFGYTGRDSVAAGKKLMDAICERFDIQKTGMHPIGQLIGTHVGPGCVAVVYVMKDQERE
ncbi:MAG: DegV family protein [Clostridia bacterium]|nr:DegV family protein [Clostridia bacterium]